jgi:hypothetical protein
MGDASRSIWSAILCRSQYEINNMGEAQFTSIANGVCAYELLLYLCILYYLSGGKHDVILVAESIMLITIHERQRGNVLRPTC